MPHRLFGYILLGVILGSPLLLTGGNEVLFTILLGLTLLLSFLFLLKQPLDGALKVPLRLFLAFIGCQLLTLIPLPVSWIRWLSPGLHKVLLNFPEVAYHTLSWDAILTMKTLAIYVAAAGVFLVAYHLWEDPLEKVPFVVQLFFWTGTFWVAVSLFLHYTTPGRVPFLPWQPEPWFFGLFTNANIFGGYCALIVPLGLGWGRYRLGVRNSDAGEGLLVLVLTLIAAGGIFAAGSVGAAIAVVLAVVFYFLPKRMVTVPLLLVLVVGGGAIAGPALWPHAHESALDRMAFARLAWRGIGAMPLSGAGAGTTALVGPRFQEPAGDSVLEEIHNDWLELLLTSGLGGALLIAALLILAARIAPMFRRPHVLRSGLAAGLLALAIHSAVDFPVQNFTVMAQALFCLGFLSCLGASGKAPGCRTEHRALLAGLLAGLLLALASAWGLIGLRSGRASGWHPQRSLALGRSGAAEVEALLRGHVLHAPLWGELARAQERDGRFEEALAAVERALLLQPVNPRLHFLAARVTFILGRPEETRSHLAAAYAIVPPDAIAAYPLSIDEAESVLFAAAPAARRHYGPGAEAIFLRSYRHLQDIGSRRSAEYILLVADWMPAGSAVQALASDELLLRKDLDGAREKITRLLEEAPGPRASLLAAQLARIEGDPASMRRWLQKGLTECGTARNAWLTVTGAQMLSEFSPEEGIQFATAGFQAHPDPRTARTIALAEKRRDRPRIAVEWLQKAIELDRDDAASYRDLLQLYRDLGDAGRHRIILEQARVRFPDQAWESLDALR